MIQSLKITTGLRNNNTVIVISHVHKKTFEIDMLWMFVKKLHCNMFAYIHRYIYIYILPYKKKIYLN